MRRIRRHLTYANVISILPFIVLTGGTAVALKGKNTVQSSDIGPGAQVKSSDIAANAVKGSDIDNGSIAGRDVRNKSGVDTCVNTVRLGDLCFRAENNARPYLEAAQHCANLNLRLPSWGEAKALATNYNLPNVDQGEEFWTDEIVTAGASDQHQAFLENDAGLGLNWTRASWNNSVETVCVTTPTN